MSMLYEGLEALAIGAKAIDAARERAKHEYLSTVLTEMEEFPPEAFEHGELPTYKAWLRSRVRLFPLGEFRRVWLEPLKGRTTLYIGSDRRLYEYGPRVISSHDMPSPVAGNPVKLRMLHPDELSLGDLLTCRELLRRIWL